MKRQLLALSRRYQAALRKHLQPGPPDRVPARRLGEKAVTLGLETPDIARIHKTALAALVLPNCSPANRRRSIQLKRAEIFFNEATAPIVKMRRAGVASTAHLIRQNRGLTERTAQLVATQRHLKHGIVQRKEAEVALRKSGRRYGELLRESQHLQRQLRRLTHRLLSAQETEREKISHELHDGVAQTLLGINVRLLTLKKVARGNTADLAKEIASTQRVVEESVQSINRLARELDLHEPA